MHPKKRLPLWPFVVGAAVVLPVCGIGVFFVAMAVIGFTQGPPSSAPASGGGNTDPNWKANETVNLVARLKRNPHALTHSTEKGSRYVIRTYSNVPGWSVVSTADSDDRFGSGDPMRWKILLSGGSNCDVNQFAPEVTRVDGNHHRLRGGPIGGLIVRSHASASCQFNIANERYAEAEGWNVPHQ